MSDFGSQSKKSVLNGEEMFQNEDYRREDETRPDQIDNAPFLDYGDDYDDYAQRRKLLSIVTQETNNMPENISDTKLHKYELQRRTAKNNASQPQLKSQKLVKPLSIQASKHHLRLRQNQTEGQVKKVAQKKPKRKSKTKKGQKPVERVQPKVKEQPEVPPDHLISKPNLTQIQRQKDSKFQLKEQGVPPPRKATLAPQLIIETRDKRLTTSKRGGSLVRKNRRETESRQHVRDKGKEMNMPLPQDQDKSIGTANLFIRETMDINRAGTKEEENQVWEEDELHFNDLIRGDMGEVERNSLWEAFEYFESPGNSPPVFVPEAKWSQTFHFSPLELHSKRTDKINLKCNISGNLLLVSRDALHVVKAFMDKLNEKHSG